MAMRFFCQSVRSKTVFSEMYSGRNNLFRKKLYLTLLSERLIVSKKRLFGTLRPLFRTLVNLDKREYRFRRDLRRNNFFRKMFCFQTWSLNFLFSRVALRSPKFVHLLLVEFGGVKTPFSIWTNLRKNDLFIKWFCSRPCATNANWFSNVVCGLAERFTSNVKMKSEN